MTKDEILAKSREENKDQDLYEKDMLKKSQSWGWRAALILSVAFMCVQSATGHMQEYRGILAILCCMNFGSELFKALQKRKTMNFVSAGCWLVATVIFAAMYVVYLKSTQG